ncbi:glutathione S-transferase [Phlegmacium glaucopus]|nr:glutathione S-transferase [Phlegmacium glaucopus]
MVLKLYGAPPSPYVRLVAMVLLEKQVPFELVLVDYKNSEHKSPEYLTKHPFGQNPYIDDDGFILYESKAICYYIASKYPNQGTPLLPTGLEANALFQQAVCVEASHFNQHAFAAAKEVIVKRYQGLTPDQAIFEKHIADLSGKLDVYDKTLSKQKYLLGDEISLADLYHIPIGSLLASAGSNVMESKPNVDRWFKDICSRPSWVAVKDDIKSTN